MFTHPFKLLIPSKANKFVIFLALLALTRLFLDAILVFQVIFWIPTNNASNVAWVIANCVKVLINAKPVIAISIHWLHSQNRALSVINQIKNYLLWNYAIFVMIIVKFVTPPLDAKLVTINISLIHRQNVFVALVIVTSVQMRILVKFVLKTTFWIKTLVRNAHQTNIPISAHRTFAWIVTVHAHHAMDPTQTNV